MLEKRCPMLAWGGSVLVEGLLLVGGWCQGSMVGARGLGSLLVGVNGGCWGFGLAAGRGPGVGAGGLSSLLDGHLGWVLGVWAWCWLGVHSECWRFGRSAGWRAMVSARVRSGCWGLGLVAGWGSMVGARGWGSVLVGGP